MPILRKSVLRGAARNHRFRHSKQQSDEMRIVNVQVEHRSAPVLRLPIIGEPRWIRDHALEAAAAKHAILTAAYCLEGPSVFGKEWHHMADEQLSSSLLCRAGHAIA